VIPTSSTGLNEEQLGLALQGRTVLAIEVVCDKLNWESWSINTMNCSRETIMVCLNIREISSTRVE